MVFFTNDLRLLCMGRNAEFGTDRPIENHKHTIDSQTMKFLLLTPPLTQLNTPYPATTVLKGFLQMHKHQVAQADLGIDLVLGIYNRRFLQRLFASTGNPVGKPRMQRIYANHDRYVACVDDVVRFLQGKDATLAPRIANRTLLPEGPRFDNMADLEWAYGTSGTDDRARYLATLFIEDIADYIRETTAPYFDLIRYAEHLAAYAPEFDEMEAALNADTTIVDHLLIDILRQHILACNPDVVGFAVPFPGCLYAALLCGKWVKDNYPGTKVVIGGGFANTEWRSLAEERLFKYTDFVVIDDGELPLLRLAKYLNNEIDATQLVRTYYLENNAIRYSGNDAENIPFAEGGTPCFEGLEMGRYLSMAEVTNPMHQLWSNGKWNKMMLSHGCYWAKCAFCDTCLDYIARYDAPTAQQAADRMADIMRQTGQSGFHFVDEAMSPQLLKNVSTELINRQMTVSYWGNIRFEKAYNAELCNLMADAGCIAVSGGLEVASNRLLKLMNKGVSIEQTVNAARNFTNAGIMVHTYLMYGFPTETLQETINALEVVRRMFDEGIVQSAFWHRYAMTAHSPSGREPEKYGAVRTTFEPNPFCNNEVDFDYDFDYDIEAVGEGLRFATYNFMNGLGLDRPLRKWFRIKVPNPKI